MDNHLVSDRLMPIFIIRCIYLPLGYEPERSKPLTIQVYIIIQGIFTNNKFLDTYLCVMAFYSLLPKLNRWGKS